MRAWMQAEDEPFTAACLCAGLGIPPGKEREVARNALGDFVKRGEVYRVDRDLRVRHFHIWRYRYCKAWARKAKGDIRPKILKAMYVSGTFSVRDLVRLCHPPEETEITRSWAEKLTRRLRRDGHLAIVGRRPCAHGAGAETIYHVADRDKFRLEVMR